MKRFLKAGLVLALIGTGVVSQAATELVIATVNNGHMIEMQKLTPFFEKANPDIKLKWVTLEEGTLRQRVTTDIATKGGQFDVMTIGLYETPIWSKKGWLKPIATDAAYDVDDLLPAIRDGLSNEGKLYAAPFYGESSMLMYRKDLADKVGVKFPEQPTWAQVKEFADKANDPKAGVYGMCLRGKPGWGDNMAFLTTLVNTNGGQWFDMQWKPQIDTKPWKDAITFYVDLMKKDGPPAPRPTASTRTSRSSTKASARRGWTRPSRLRSSATRSSRRWPTRWPSRRRPPPPRPRAPTGCGRGTSPFRPARPRTRRRRSSSSGPLRRTT